MKHFQWVTGHFVRCDVACLAVDGTQAWLGVVVTKSDAPVGAMFDLVNGSLLVR